MAHDLNNVKEQVQIILEAANTTTASVDLSSGLETRVQRILKVNPGRIPVQASWYPFVTVFIDRKSMSHQDIAATQSNAKRRAEVDLKIIGAVWNSTISNDEEDPADEDCEQLMESIEQVIRNAATLNGTVLWTTPTDVTYHNANLDEETHVRVGILNIRTSMFY